MNARSRLPETEAPSSEPNFPPRPPANRPPRKKPLKDKPTAADDSTKKES